jgi:ankyrin repeat protein
MIHDVFIWIDKDPADQFEAKLNDVDLSLKTSAGRTILHMAIIRRKPLHSALLIKRGVDINAVDSNGQTPLHLCAIQGDLETAKLLLAHGAKTMESDRYGNEPLWYAVFYSRGKYDLVKLLFKEKNSAAHANKAGRSPMDLAKEIGDMELQNILR